jgi:hypothetical protein
MKIKFGQLIDVFGNRYYRLCTILQLFVFENQKHLLHSKLQIVKIAKGRDISRPFAIFVVAKRLKMGFVRV